MFKVIFIDVNVCGFYCLFFKSRFCYLDVIKTNVYFTWQSVALIKVIGKRNYVHMKKIGSLEVI